MVASLPIPVAAVRTGALRSRTKPFGTPTRQNTISVPGVFMLSLIRKLSAILRQVTELVCMVKDALLAVAALLVAVEAIRHAWHHLVSGALLTSNVLK